MPPYDPHPYTSDSRRRRRRPLADIALCFAIGFGLAWVLIRWAAA